MFFSGVRVLLNNYDQVQLDSGAVFTYFFGVFFIIFIFRIIVNKIDTKNKL